MMTPQQRATLVAFLTTHASDDVLIQAACRVSNHIEDLKAIEAFIKGTPAAARASDGGRKFTDEGVGKEPVGGEPKSTPVETTEPEDLGEPCKKLGSNGQNIEKLLRNHSARAFSIREIGKSCGLSEAKVKPMIALLIERSLVVRVGSNTYQAMRTMSE